MNAPSPPRIAIVMATYDGARYLGEQLESLAAQELRPARILVGDDGSRDDTRAILADFAAAHPDMGMDVTDGPGRGAATNFMHLLRRVPDDTDLVALSDQDDVWLPDKLARAAAALAEVDLAKTTPAETGTPSALAGPDAATGTQTGTQTGAAPDMGPDMGPDTGPVLYCSRSWECDTTLSRRRVSRHQPRPPGFRHALVQNIAGGNTMVLNAAAWRLVRAAAAEVRRVVVHDWWIYQIVTGAGGAVIFDPEPTLLYRQHTGNVIGANRGTRAKASRMRFLLSGRYRRWTTVNLIALNASAHRFTPANRALLTALREGRRGGLFARLSMLRRTGIYRQGREGQASLLLAVLLGRL